MSGARRIGRVTVVGAGIGGLTAALMLSRVTDRVILVERHPEPAEVGAGLALQHNGLAVLEQLGLLPAVAVQAQPISRMNIIGAHGRPVLRAALPDLGGIDHGLALSRSHLHAVMLAAVEREPRVEPRFGWTAVAAGPDGRLEVDADGRTESITAELVVGADGAGSVVRSSVGIEARQIDGATYLRGLVPGGGDAQMREYWTPLGSFGYAPLGAEVTYFWAAAHRPTVAAAVERRDLPAIIELWGAAVPVAGGVMQRVASFDELLINTVRRVTCPTWSAGRAVIIGDAAHAMAPNLGQGANSAMIDAVVLAEELATAGTVSAALQRYEARRRPVVTRIQSTAQLLERLSELDGPGTIRLRDAAIRAVTGLPGLMTSSFRRSVGPDVAAVRASPLFAQRGGGGPG